MALLGFSVRTFLSCHTLLSSAFAVRYSLSLSCNYDTWMDHTSQRGGTSVLWQRRIRQHKAVK
eukprot:366124-Amphidinium_carterae.2